MIHAACRSARLADVRLLVENGADPNLVAHVSCCGGMVLCCFVISLPKMDTGWPHTTSLCLFSRRYVNCNVSFGAKCQH